VNQSPVGERTEYRVSVRSAFKAYLRAHNVEIKIPLPAKADHVAFEASSGTWDYIHETATALWRINYLRGQSELLLVLSFLSTSSQGLAPKDFNLTSFEGSRVKDQHTNLTMPKVSARFEIDGFAVSGVEIRYIRVIERTGYHRHSQQLTYRSQSDCSNYRISLQND